MNQISIRLNKSRCFRLRVTRIDLEAIREQNLNELDFTIEKFFLYLTTVIFDQIQRILRIKEHQQGALCNLKLL